MYNMIIIFLGRVGIVIDSPFFQPESNKTEDITAAETAHMFTVRNASIFSTFHSSEVTPYAGSFYSISNTFIRPFKMNAFPELLPEENPYAKKSSKVILFVVDEIISS